MIAGVICFTGPSVQCIYAQGLSKDDLPSRFQHSLDLFDRGLCQESWNELWRFAQKRDYYALYLLAGTSIAHSFRFVFSDASRIKMEATGVNLVEKIYVPMEIYATLASETIKGPFSIELIRHLISTSKAHGREIDPVVGKQVKDCFASNESSETCVRLAIESHFIPEYEQYIATVNEINQGSLRVECAGDGPLNLSKNR